MKKDGDENSDIMIERLRRPHDDVEGLDHKSITTSPWSTRDVKNYFSRGAQVT